MKGTKKAGTIALSTILSLMLVLLAVSETTLSVSAVNNSIYSSDFPSLNISEKTLETNKEFPSSQAPKGYVLDSDKSNVQSKKNKLIAAGAKESSEANSDANWNLTDGCLTISGEGAMSELFSDDNYPWQTRASEITTVVFESGITDTGWQAFANCINLTKIEIPDTITLITAGSFYGCSSLETVELPDSVKTIGMGAFAECTKLKSVICNGVENIVNYAFQSTAFEDVVIGKKVSNFSGMAYLNCKIKSYSVEEGNENYTAIDGILYSMDLKTLSSYPAYKTGTSYTIPQTITTVGEAAFIKNQYLEQITIPDSVTRLDLASFQQCYSLSSITIPDSVTYVDYFTFYGCSSLQSVKFGNGLKKTSYQMFRACDKLSEIDFGTYLEELDAHTFAYCSSLTSVKLPENIKKIGNGCFGECYNLESFESVNLSIIPFTAFYRCYSLKNIILNSGIKQIMRAAFLYCDSLGQITLPESVIYVHPYAFPEDTEITCENSEMRKFGKNGYRYLQDISITGVNNYECALSVLELVNNEREVQGLTPLVMNESLLNTAMQRAAEISICYSHTRPDSSLCFEANSLMIAENIAIGQGSPEHVMESWMNSEGHKANILSEGYSTIGIGCYEINGTLHWVQCFGIGSDSQSCIIPANTETKQTLCLATEEFEEAQIGTNVSFSTGAQKTYSYEFYVELDENTLMIPTTTYAKLNLKNAGTGNRVPINNIGFNWSSSAEDIVIIDSSGMVSSLKPGKAEIKANLKYFNASQEITTYLLHGDVNGDGEITISDAIIIQKHIANIVTLGSDTLTVADVSKDGNISIADAIILQKYIANIITEL